MISRFKKALNAYIKNDAKAAAIASLIMDKDCSETDLIKVEGFHDSAVALLPLLSGDTHNTRISTSVIDYFFRETEGKILFIICGFSAAGKDTLASYVNHALYLDGKEFVYTKKYTTRGRRGYEGLNKNGSLSEPSGNYEYFKNPKELEKVNDAVLSYSLYGHKYALSGDHLKSSSNEDKYQLCIYGKLENIAEIKQKVFMKHKRMPFTILINSPPDDCEHRIIRRHSMPDSEQIARIREMKKQATFLSKNTTFASTAFDLILENGDDSGVLANSKVLTEFISQKMDWANE